MHGDCQIILEDATELVAILASGTLEAREEIVSTGALEGLLSMVPKLDSKNKRTAEECVDALSSMCREDSLVCSLVAEEGIALQLSKYNSWLSQAHDLQKILL